MRLRWARASLRSSEESSERGRLRGGPSLDGEGEVAAEEEGEGCEQSRDGSTVAEDMVNMIRTELRGGVVKRGTSLVLEQQELG